MDDFLQGAEQVRNKVREVLKEHWLVDVICDHEKKTDRAQCACSRIRFSEHPSVGAAIDEWIENIFSPRLLSQLAN